MEQTLRLSDLYNMKSVSDHAVSPDGSRVAYVVRGYREQKNDSYQNLWVTRTDGSGKPHRLTRTHSKDSGPAWSPDGRYLAFLSTRKNELEIELDKDEESKDDKPRAQVWILDLELGGEPRQLTNRLEGVNEFDWSPDGKRIVFVSRDPNEKQEAYLKSIRGSGENKGKGPIVLGRTQHKHDMRGYLDDVPTHLYTVTVETRQVRQLTDGECNEVSPRWSPDGKWIVFVSNRTGDADNNRRNDLWLIRPDGGDARRLTYGDLGCSSPAWSPDSERVAFVSNKQPENAYILRHVMVVEIGTAKPIGDLATYVGKGWSDIGGIVPDEFEGDPAENARRYPIPEAETPVDILTEELDRPAMGGPVWVDSENLLCLFGDRGQTRLVRADLTGFAEFVYPVNNRMSTIWYGLMDVRGGTVVVGLDRPSTSHDLFAFSADDLGRDDLDNRATQLTQVNSEWLGQRQVAEYRRIHFEDSDGVPVEALVALPPGYEDGAGRVPVVAKIHGGPMAYDAPMFRFDTQYWASMGYVVVMVNYRGSISYGEDFCTVIRGDWGRREHDDVMAGVDAVIERGWGDPDRLYVTGFSQGGIMTNWAVGHTDRFRAGASEHGEWNYAFAFGTDDTHLWWQDDLGVPWQNPEQYFKISPASGLSNINTPLLIMAGEHDWRCPLTQSEQLYVALKKRGVPTQLVIYQDERHNISTPRRAIDRVTRIARWFEQYGGRVFEDDSAEGYPDTINE